MGSTYVERLTCLWLTFSYFQHVIARRSLKKKKKLLLSFITRDLIPIFLILIYKVLLKVTCVGKSYAFSSLEIDQKEKKDF